MCKYHVFIFCSYTVMTKYYRWEFVFSSQLVSFFSCTNAQYSFVLFNETAYIVSLRGTPRWFMVKKGKKTSCMCYYFMEFRFATLLVLLLLFIQDNEKHWNWYLGYFTLYISLTLNVLTPRPELTSFFSHCTVKHIEFVNDQCTICICFNFHISCFPVPDVSISSSWYMVRLCYVACEEWFYGFCIKNISASSKSNPW